jgi:hypothetical protein
MIQKELSEQRLNEWFEKIGNVQFDLLLRYELN